MPDAAGGQIMLRRDQMTYHESNTSTGSRGDLVAFLSNHGPGELIDGLSRLHIYNARVFLELVDL